MSSTPAQQDEQVTQQIRLPYAFYSENFGLSVGYVYALLGYPQKQSSLLATMMAGTGGSVALVLMGRDLRPLGNGRLFLDPLISIGYYGESETYIDGNPNFPDHRSGSHESDGEDYVLGEGSDKHFRLRCRYLLPIGHGRDQILDDFTFDRGLCTSGATGGTAFNPLTSGKTFIEFTPFYRSIQVKSDDIEDTELKTNGYDIGLHWDNRNYPANPSRGNSLKLKASRDLGWFGSNESWSSYQFEFDQYVALGSNERFRQSVVAFDFWTAYSPSWEVSENGEISHRAPPFAGATLGGYWRMRGFLPQRFNDKAAIYYSLELRVIPEWNPFAGWDWLQDRLGVQWVQFVPFFEVGRVAPAWKLSTLHEDMKWDGGLGIRLKAQGLVLRIDTAVSEEDYQVQMMVGQPFQF